jgi:hypothetical protein
MQIQKFIGLLAAPVCKMQAVSVPRAVASGIRAVDVSSLATARGTYKACVTKDE